MTKPKHTSKKRLATRDSAWFRRKIAKLGEALNSLPHERREAFQDTLRDQAEKERVN